MRKHVEPIVKYICLILAVLVLCQLIGMVLRVNPLHGVTVPALPTLTTNVTETASANDKTSMHGAANTLPVSSNSIVAVGGETNQSKSSKTNSEHANGTTVPPPAGTNVVSSATTTNGLSTNNIANTNSVVAIGAGTNVSNAAKTNAEHTVIVSLPIGTNAIASAAGTNHVSTNQVVSTNSIALGTNNIRPNHPSGNEPPTMGRMPMGMRGGMGMGRQANLPPAIQAQVTKIIESEILGPVPHPLPMALMGIAGDVAFLRSPSGQTGMVKIGDSLGEIKLVRIGINRVLVEQDGQQKELTIFDGYGGESLLEKTGGTNNETHK